MSQAEGEVAHVRKALGQAQQVIAATKKVWWQRRLYKKQQKQCKQQKQHQNPQQAPDAERLYVGTHVPTPALCAKSHARDFSFSNSPSYPFRTRLTAGC